MKTMPTKICPSCGEENHVRKSSCPCGHIFYAKAEVKPSRPHVLSQHKNAASHPASGNEGKTMPTKYCPECGAGNHVRKSSCPCGYNFYTKAEPKTEPKFDIPDIAQQSRVAAKRSAPILEEPKTFFVGTTVAVPSGHCPISLNDTDAETVYAWADKVRRHHESQNERITNEGLLHYSRQFFPMHTKSVKGMTPEYLAVRILLGLDKTEGEAEE